MNKMIIKYLVVVSTIIFSFISCGLGGGGSNVKVNVTITPIYPCLGDNVTFIIDAKHVDRIEVKDNKNNTVHQTTSRNSSFVINNIALDMLPLRATGWSGSHSKTVTIGPSGNDYTLRIISEEIVTDPILFDQKISNRTQTFVSNVCGCYEYSYESVTCIQEFPAYSIDETINGYSVNLVGYFSNNAKVTKINNLNNYSIIYEKDGKSYNVSGQSLINTNNNPYAKGIWVGNFVNPITYNVGVYIQAPKINQCSATAGYANPPIVQNPEMDTKFSVVCNVP